MGAIQIVDYDPRWPALFELHAGEIAALLAPLACDIHHIGSTAVPGLAAKPKLDIDAVMRSPGDLLQALERPTAAGFTFHGDPYGEFRWTFTRDGHDGYGIRLYVCAAGNPAHLERIRFRDHLRGNPDAAADYEALKRRLAGEAAGDFAVYTDGKSEFVGGIVLSAGPAQASAPACSEMAMSSRKSGR